jgi:hypothetical protein
VNWQHLQAFVWLRWRLSVNQWRRGGKINAVLMAILTVGLVAIAIPLFAGCFVAGLLLFPRAEPVYLLLGWDGMVFGFVFFWCIGLVAELQRTEALSLANFLHLPVSVKNAFLINYISSLVRLSLIVFVPILFGFGLALPFAQGARLVWVLPLTAAFLLMVTAVTYQFQGWLASLMSNPRRRRTVIMVATVFFLLLTQAPNLFIFWRPRNIHQTVSLSDKLGEELATLDRDFQAQQLDASEHLRRQQELFRRYEQETHEEEFETHERFALANLILPIGWLPLGVMRAAAGNVLPAILGCLAMTLIGSASLWRAYRTTIGLYQGRFTARKVTGQKAAAAEAGALAGALPSAASSRSETRDRAASLLETRLPGLSEPVSAVTLAAVRSLLRSAESKMMLLSAAVMSVFFGSMLLRSSSSSLETLRTLVAIGAIAMALFSVLQLMANQFGFDRDGFRVFVLCAASRRDILLGKNLAFAPLVLVMTAILLAVVEVVCPLRWDHLLSMVPQGISMFLLFCLLMNLLSIYAPMQIAAGSLRPARPKLLPALLQMVAFMVLFPLSQAPTLLPLGVEAWLGWQGWISRAPVCLALALVECAAVIWLYSRLLDWQGALLRTGEQRILETVTNRVP